MPPTSRSCAARARRIVETLSEYFPAIVEAQPELMAQHCAGAGLTERAVAEWERAGQYASVRLAFAEAIGHFAEALELLAALPPGCERDQLEVQLRIGLGRALASSRGFTATEVEQVYARALEICEGLDAPPISVLHGLLVVPLVRGDRRETLRMAAILHRRSKVADSIASQLVLHGALSHIAFYYGDYVVGKRHGERARRAIEALDRAQELLAIMQKEGFDFIYGHFFEAMCDLKMGVVDRAASLWESALVITERTPNRYVIAINCVAGTEFAIEMGDFTKARDLADQAISVATDNDFMFLTAPGLCFHGWTLAQLGEAKAGIAEIRRGLALIERFGVMLLYPSNMMRLAEAYLCDGNVAEGMAVVRDALVRSQTSLGCNHVPELRRIEGEFLLLQGDEAAAEHAFRESLAVAVGQHAHLDALRTVTCFGRLLVRRGRKDEARMLVGEAASKIIGGHEIPPVVAAHELLAELS